MTDRQIEWLREQIEGWEWSGYPEEAAIGKSIIARLEAADRLVAKCRRGAFFPDEVTAYDAARGAK